MAMVLAKGDQLGGWDNKKYTVLSILNRGSYGVVYAARNARTRYKVAIKQLPKHTQTTELEILTRLRKASSRNLLKLLDSFSDDHSSYIVNDFCSLGDLYEVIAANRVPTDAETISELVLQLILAVEACHSVGVYHRDIKPENIFLTIEEAKATTNGDGEVVLKLGDFGLATCETFSDEIGTGSDRYMAPEQFRANSAGGYEPALVDIWALGIVVMNTLFGRNPWKTPTEEDPVFKDFLRDPESLFEHFTDLTRDTYSVIRYALNVDPEQRSLSKMKAAVAGVLDWSHATVTVGDDVDVSSRASTNLVDYDNTGPTVGRTPLRTPSVAHHCKLSTAAIGSFPWSKALANTRQEDHRNGLGFAKPAQHIPSTLSSSWRKADFGKHLGSLDSGLGASLSSYNLNRSTIPLPSREAQEPHHFAASVPAIRINFPRPSPNKGHLKFGTSWADQDSDSDDLVHPVWSHHSRATIAEAKEENDDEDMSSGATTSSLEDGELFAFEEGPSHKVSRESIKRTTNRVPA